MSGIATAAWPEVRAWRKAARAQLIAARIALPAPVRAAWTAGLVERLRPLLLRAPAPVSFYWPFKAEPDFRPLMRELDAAGIAVALPVAFKLGEALTFRPWHRGCAMERGIWDIPIPATPEEVRPRTLIAPIVGFDGGNFRLGYGGGFFDRTLEKLGGGAQAIGVGFSMFRLETIAPQPHDVAMARIVTEQDDGLPVGAAGKVCYADEMPPDYAGYLPAGEIAAILAPLAGILPPERRGLLDFILWRLEAAPEIDGKLPDLDAVRGLAPRIRDDAIHAALGALLAEIPAPGLDRH